MLDKLSKNRMLLLLPLLLLAGWLLPLAACSAPLPLPPGPLDTNLFNTNGLVVPPDVQFLLHDLQTNLTQLRPFLAIINGEGNTNETNNARAEAPPPPLTMSPRPNTNATNGAPLIYGLGAALENVQTDIQELLPRLAAMVGQTNYSSGNPVSTNNATVPNRFDSTNSAPGQPAQFQKIFFIQPLLVQFIHHQPTDVFSLALAKEHQSAGAENLEPGAAFF